LALLLLILVNLLLLVGMVCLPSLVETGIGSVFTRVWLFFGMLVFASHYNYYCLEMKKKKEHSVRQARTTSQYRSERLPVRNSVYK
jgi:hypothetical protein